VAGLSRESGFARPHSPSPERTRSTAFRDRAVVDNGLKGPPRRAVRDAGQAGARPASRMTYLK